MSLLHTKKPQTHFCPSAEWISWTEFTLPYLLAFTFVLTSSTCQNIFHPNYESYLSSSRLNPTVGPFSSRPLMKFTVTMRCFIGHVLHCRFGEILCVKGTLYSPFHLSLAHGSLGSLSATRSIWTLGLWNCQELWNSGVGLFVARRNMCIQCKRLISATQNCVGFGYLCSFDMVNEDYGT